MIYDKVQHVYQCTTQWLNKIFDRGFLIILIFYFSSYWFFSFWVLQNHGVTWSGPFSIPHHPFKLALFDTDFWQTLTYMFVQSPLYSYFSWFLYQINPGDDGFTVYLTLHYVTGFFALCALYRMSQSLKIAHAVVVVILSYFVFNVGFYFGFSTGWNDYLCMCLTAYLAFFFMRLTEEFTSFNLIFFLTTLTLLVSYRALFSPLTFFLPLVIVLMLIFKKHWKKILIFSIVPFFITLAPYVKNQIIFGSFNVANGQFAAAFKASTYQWAHKDLIMEDVRAGRLNPIVLCFSSVGKQITYQGQVFTQENCKNNIIPEMMAPKVQQLLAARPYLAQPEILQPENNVSALGDYIPNTLTGYVLAQEMVENSKSFIKHHPLQYLNHIKHNFYNLFKSNTQYHFSIAVNWRHFPEWFNQRFNLAFYHQISYLKKYQVFATTEYNILIAIGMLGCMIYAFLYAGNVSHKKLISTIHFFFLIFLLIMFKKRYAFINLTLICSGILLLFGIAQTIKTLWLQSINIHDATIKSRLLIAFMAMVSLYLMIIVSLIPSSEQERYRFAVEGLLNILFMFWLCEMGTYIRKHLARLIDKKSYKTTSVI